MFLSILIICLGGVVSPLPMATIQYRNVHFPAYFITRPKDAESVLIPINDTVARVNDVYISLDESVLTFLEYCQVRVTFDKFPEYAYIFLGMVATLYLCICFLVGAQLSELRKNNVVDEKPHLIILQNPMDEECTICLESSCNVVIKNCNHLFHFDCIQQWFQRKPTCPLCKC